MGKTWIRIRDEVLDRAEAMLKRGEMLKSDDINSILDLRYHHTQRMNLQYIDSRTPKIIFDSLVGILAKPRELSNLRLSYLVLYVSSIEWEVYLMHQKGKAIVRLINTIVSEKKKDIAKVVDSR